MAKAMTIQEKRKEMEKALERLTAFERIISVIENDMKWAYGLIQYGDDGKALEDENGEYIRKYPSSPEDYNYMGYMAYKSVVDEIKALV